MHMFDLLKKLFYGNTNPPQTGEETEAQRKEPGTVTRTCRECGKTFTLPENVQHWPDCCRECRAKAPAELITRTRRGCGRSFTFPSTVRHWPNFCRECQAKRKRKVEHNGH